MFVSKVVVLVIKSFMDEGPVFVSELVLLEISVIFIELLLVVILKS